MSRRLGLLIGALILVLVGAVVVTHLVMAPHEVPAPIPVVESAPGFDVIGE